MHKQDDITKNNYQIRLNAIDASRFLLRQGLPFHGHDETINVHKCFFVELLKYTTEQNEVVSKIVLRNALGNNHMTFPKI